MASSTGFRQALPPKGGFDPLDFTKKVTYKKTNGFKLLGIFLGLKICGGLYIYNKRDKNQLIKLENSDARLAESAFRLAETDRLYLKHLRDMRDEERDLMKDVPGWEVGTLFGERIMNREKRQFMTPTKLDHMALEDKLGVIDYLHLKVKHK